MRIESSRLSIQPAHALVWHRDAQDNSAAVVDFTEPTRLLEFDSEVVVQHSGGTPFAYTSSPRAAQYPFQYDPNERPELVPYLLPLFTKHERDLGEWVMAYWVPGQTCGTYDLLDRLNRAIPAQFTYRQREEPGVQRPAETLACGSGSCRDFATLFMEACRHLGLASRFVSGYRHEPGLPPGAGATHAWCEVYLTGTGWRGFDSTTGEPVGNDHIAVAVARHPEAVPPVAGSYTGAASSRMEVLVEVNELD